MEARLETLDLNLLVVLEALLLERNVTRAAVRLRKSQPAVSSALNRLRRALGDPLFVRGRTGITPTPRALELQGPLGSALATLRTAIEPSPAFDPTTAQRTFVLAASDHAQAVVVPRLAGRLAQWPGLTVRVVPLPEQFPAEALERGELDLVLGVFDVAPGDRAPRGLQRQALATERLCVVGRAGHPALRRPRLDRLVRLPQLNVSPRGGTVSRFELRDPLAGDRHIVLYLPHFLTAPWVLTQTDLLALLPERLAGLFAQTFALEGFVLEAPRLKLQQLWHPRAQHLAAHRWLRAEVVSAAKAAPTWLEPRCRPRGQ